MSHEPRRVEGLDLASLEALVAVIQSKSFTAASRALGVTQPAVSAAVKKLEERVGTNLVIRTRKGASASGAGEILMKAAIDAFEELEGAVTQISEQQEQPIGRVRLGCHESLAGYALPGFISGFFEDYPKVEVSLWNGRSQAVERAIVDGEVDVGLVVNPSHHPETVITPMFNDSVMLVCERNLKQRSAKKVVEERPLLFVPELAQSQRVIRDLAKEGIQPARTLTCSSLGLVKSLTLSQVGVGILPERVARHGVDVGKLVSLSPPLPTFADNISLLRRFDLPMNAAVRAVLDRLTAHCQSI